MSRQTIARINLSALRHNLSVVRRLAPGSEVACVIKAGGYGHGIRRVARALQSADLFAVATPGEARAVRDAGWQGRLVLLEGFANRDDFELARKLRAELVVHHASQLPLLAERGCVEGQRLWLKLDTGMHRLGFAAHELRDILATLGDSVGSEPPILMSHFACADEADHPLNTQQMQVFDQAVAGFDLPQSLANSAAILNFPSAHRDCVRPGVMLYGISPLPGHIGHEHDLRPAMTLSCELIAVNQCRAGDHIGYGATYVCERDMVIGVAAIGYGDGYSRQLRQGTPVLVNDQQTQLLGRVSMDLITVDLSEIESAQVGDEVVLWGPGLPVEQVAQWADAIPYELVCGLTGRVDRLDA